MFRSTKICHSQSSCSFTAGWPQGSFWGQQRGPWGPRWWTSRPRWGRGCCWRLECSGCLTAVVPSAWNEIFVGWLFLAVVSFQNCNHTHIYLRGFFFRLMVYYEITKVVKVRCQKRRKHKILFCTDRHQTRFSSSSKCVEPLERAILPWNNIGARLKLCSFGRPLADGPLLGRLNVQRFHEVRRTLKGGRTLQGGRTLEVEPFQLLWHVLHIAMLRSQDWLWKYWFYWEGGGWLPKKIL